MSVHPDLDWVDWCCVSCRRERRTIHALAVDGACSHGKKCEWGLDKYDGHCSPIGVPSEQLAGLTDPPQDIPGLTLPEMIAERRPRALRRSA